MSTFSDFDIFARVARTGNMSAAGREMGVSPAVVSKRISLLEEQLGARLFQRTTRQLTLTETGEGYFNRIVRILNLIAEADDFVSRRNTKPCGLLRVTAPPAFARLHMTAFLPSFVERYPEIQLELHVTDLFCDLVRDGYDLAVRIGELPDSSLVARKLCADKRILCAAPAYLEKNGVPRSINDLERLIMLLTGTQDLWKLEGPGGEVNIRPRSALRTNNGDFAREVLKSGLGVGLRPLWEVADLMREGLLVHVLPDYQAPPHFGIYAVYPSREFMPSKVDAFIQYLAEHFGGEPAWERDLAAASEKGRKSAATHATAPRGRQRSGRREPPEGSPHM